MGGRNGQLYDRMSRSASRLIGQNVRGLSLYKFPISILTCAHARACTSANSIGFCVIWVCISSSSSSGGKMETQPERNRRNPGVSFSPGKQKQAVRLPGPFHKKRNNPIGLLFPVSCSLWCIQETIPEKSMFRFFRFFVFQLLP